MYPTLRLALVALCIGPFLMSCESEDDAPAPALEEKTYSNLFAPADPGQPGQPATGYEPWRYFSLRTGQLLTNADSNSTDWDLAFKSTTIRTNSGISGPGEGRALVVVSAFEEVLEAPADTELRSDVATNNYAILTGSGNGWYNYNPANMVISPIPGRTIVVKLGDGSGYAKVSITSYYQNAPTSPTGTEPSRYYTFRYVVNTDGTRRLN